MVTTWVKVRNSKVTHIPEPKNINRLLNQGYAVTRVTETKVSPTYTKTELKTFSPLTKLQAWEKHKGRGIRGMSF